MSNAFVEGLFLLAFWAPPMVIAIGALSLVVHVPSARRSRVPSGAPKLAH